MNMDSLIGQVFGKLTVIEQVPSANGRRQWRCQCECGKIITASTTALRGGDTSSCGCLQFKRKGNTTNHTINRKGGRKPEDLTNQVFGNLIALEMTPERKNNSVVWKCLCKCGNITYATAASLKNKGTQSCGCIHSFGEQRITSLLQQNNINFIREYNVKINGSNRRFDFALIENNKITRLIEFDGLQHSANSSGYLSDSYEAIHNRDLEKNQWALENNIPLVRIPYNLRDSVQISDLLEDKYLL